MKRLGHLCWLLVLISGCTGPSQTPDLVWGKKGVMPGDLTRPRAITVDGQGRLWIVDFTARVQAYNAQGEYLGITFITPDYRNGRPSGLGVTREGRLIVCDSHYHCVRIYDEQAKECQVLGGQAGAGAGEFGYISDCIQDDDGYFYISEFGSNERITKLDANGQFIKSFGQPGLAEGEFNRPRALALGPDQNLYVADACNHRIQVFSREGQYLRSIGSEGKGLGQLSYPYDLTFDKKGNLYVIERGNHRLQKFLIDGTSLGTWGQPGRHPGQLHDPWALAVDSNGDIHIVDTENHRIQKVRW